MFSLLVTVSCCFLVAAIIAFFVARVIEGHFPDFDVCLFSLGWSYFIALSVSLVCFLLEKYLTI